MIRVIAIVTTKPGQRDSVLEALRANVPNVEAEQGCISSACLLPSKRTSVEVTRASLSVWTKAGGRSFPVMPPPRMSAVQMKEKVLQE